MTTPVSAITITVMLPPTASLTSRSLALSSRGACDVRRVVARGAAGMDEHTRISHAECDIPSIRLDPRGAVGGNDDEDDDDAAVYLQELGLNFAITARSKGRSSTLPSAFPSHEASRAGSAVSSALSSLATRQKTSRALVEVANKVSAGGEGQLYRLLSAKRNHIQQLNSDVVFLHNRIKELEEQNRLLVRLGKRQEAALVRYQDMKSELPHIIEAHKIEINVLHEKLRRSTELNRRNAEKLKQTDARILKLTEELTRLRELSRKRHLPERELLNKKLSAATHALEEKEKEKEELRRRLGVLEKALKQQVQAEVGRHRATAKKLYSLQLEHHKLEEQLKEKERDLAALQHYSRSSRCGRSSTAGDDSTTSTTANSSRSPSLSARRKSGSRQRSSGASSTSGIASAGDVGISASDSRGSLALDTSSSRLPPISAESRRRKESLGGSPSAPLTSPEPPLDVPTRRARHRALPKESAEERRAGRIRRGRRSPRPSTDDDYLQTPRCTPTPSPHTTPEPPSQGEGGGAEPQQDEGGGEGRLGHSDHKRRQRLAASLRDARRQESADAAATATADAAEERKRQGSSAGSSGREGTRGEFSLIEHYPPRERLTLSGSDSGGSGSTPPPTAPPRAPPRAPTVLSEAKAPAQRSRLDSPLAGGAVGRRHHTITAHDLRTVSSLSRLDSANPAMPKRGAITP
ncbi:serine/arginine repetitive matrix protein 1-like [Penaeus chinensis]|uniref:serine/arginine repetitive matrix protein 1-like n=1 Tax=Penaeus chinensis TaxID=139456 RepID=UPI001FB85CE1|nr:serine/arginine repetitive matrix protein 1-like [Penaeus chinensis]